MNKQTGLLSRPGFSYCFSLFTPERAEEIDDAELNMSFSLGETGAMTESAVFNDWQPNPRCHASGDAGAA